MININNNPETDNKNINKKDLEVFLRENIEYLRKKKGFSFKNTTRIEMVGVVQHFLIEYAEEFNANSIKLYSDEFERNRFVERLFYRVLFDGYSLYIYDKEKRRINIGNISLSGTKEEIGLEIYKMINKKDDKFKQVSEVFADNFQDYLKIC